jgi:hypothetical protein
MTDPTTELIDAPKPFYKRWWFIAFAVVFVLGAIGSTGDSQEPASTIAAAESTTATSQDSQTVTTAAEVTTTSPPTTAAPTTTTTTTLPPWTEFTVEGAGDDFIEFSVPNGDFAVLDLTHNGSRNFIVVAFDAGGDRLDGLVNEIGSYSGTRPINLFEGKKVTDLEIRADGAWSITVRPIETVRSFDGIADGIGDDVLVFVGAGNRITGTHDGSSNFIVTGYGSGGRDGIFNEIGAYSGSARLESGTVLIVVRADGNWTLEVE